MDNVNVKKASANNTHKTETSVAEPESRTCGMSHIVTGWVDTRGNDRVSVAMILPSGVNPVKPDTLVLQVSECGKWLNVKIKVDVALVDIYQCYHSYLIHPPYKVRTEALDYHGKVCAHRRIIAEMIQNVHGDHLWDEHNIFLGRVCRRTLAGGGDGDTIFYGSTCVGPRKNGTRILHVELVVEGTAKRLTKKPKVGKASDWYEHKEVDGDSLDIDEEKKAREDDRHLGDEDSDDYVEDDDEIETPTNKSKTTQTKRVTRKSTKAGTSSDSKKVGAVTLSAGGEEG